MVTDFRTKGTIAKIACKNRTQLFSHLVVTLSSSTITIALIYSVKGVGPKRSKKLGTVVFFFFVLKQLEVNFTKEGGYVYSAVFTAISQSKARREQIKEMQSSLQSYLGREKMLKFSCGKWSKLRASHGRNKAFEVLWSWGSSLQTYLTDKDAHVLLLVGSVAQGQSQLLLAVDPTQLHLLGNTGTKHIRRCTSHSFEFWQIDMLRKNWTTTANYYLQ